MDAALLRALQRLGRAADVPLLRACERADDRPLDLLGDSAHGHEIVPRGGRKAGLDHVHAEAGEHMGDSELIGDVQIDARRLLAVAERGVKNADSSAQSTAPPPQTPEYAAKPPSTGITVPLTKPEALASHRYSSVPIRSDGSPNRFIGVWARILSVRGVGLPSAS